MNSLRQLRNRVFKVGNIIYHIRFEITEKKYHHSSKFLVQEKLGSVCLLSNALHKLVNEEFALLFHCNYSENPDFPYWN